jgi:hypothetical protein
MRSEAAIEPDNVSDDFGRKTVALATDAVRDHQSCLIANAATDNLRWFM